MTEWVRPKDVAEYLSVSLDTVYKWALNKEKYGTPVHRIGRLWKFDKAEIDAWVKRGKDEKSLDQPGS